MALSHDTTQTSMSHDTTQTSIQSPLVSQRYRVMLECDPTLVCRSRKEEVTLCRYSRSRRKPAFTDLQWHVSQISMKPKWRNCNHSSTVFVLPVTPAPRYVNTIHHELAVQPYHVTDMYFESLLDLSNEDVDIVSVATWETKFDITEEEAERSFAFLDQDFTADDFDGLSPVRQRHSSINDLPIPPPEVTTSSPAEGTGEREHVWQLPQSVVREQERVDFFMGSGEIPISHHLEEKGEIPISQHHEEKVDIPISLHHEEKVDIPISQHHEEKVDIPISQHHEEKGEIPILQRHEEKRKIPISHHLEEKGEILISQHQEVLNTYHLEEKGEEFSKIHPLEIEEFLMAWNLDEKEDIAKPKEVDLTELRKEIPMSPGKVGVGDFPSSPNKGLETSSSILIEGQEQMQDSHPGLASVDHVEEVLATVRDTTIPDVIKRYQTDNRKTTSIQVTLVPPPVILAVQEMQRDEEARVPGKPTLHSLGTTKETPQDHKAIIGNVIYQPVQVKLVDSLPKVYKTNGHSKDTTVDSLSDLVDDLFKSALNDELTDDSYTSQVDEVSMGDGRKAEAEMTHQATKTYNIVDQSLDSLEEQLSEDLNEIQKFLEEVKEDDIIDHKYDGEAQHHEGLHSIENIKEERIVLTDQVFAPILNQARFETSDDDVIVTAADNGSYLDSTVVKKNEDIEEETQAKPNNNIEKHTGDTVPLDSGSAPDDKMSGSVAEALHVKPLTQLVVEVETQFWFKFDS